MSRETYGFGAAMLVIRTLCEKYRVCNWPHYIRQCGKYIQHLTLQSALEIHEQAEHPVSLYNYSAI